MSEHLQGLDRTWKAVHARLDVAQDESTARKFNARISPEMLREPRLEKFHESYHIAKYFRGWGILTSQRRGGEKLACFEGPVQLPADLSEPFVEEKSRTAS